MVSLVKSLGDLPNVIYLLSYEESRLAELLETAGMDGNDFLQRVVQYPVHLPLCRSSNIVQLLNADLSTLLADIIGGRKTTSGHHVVLRVSILFDYATSCSPLCQCCERCPISAQRSYR